MLMENSNWLKDLVMDLMRWVVSVSVYAVGVLIVYDRTILRNGDRLI
jgi:hypothetical protein